MIRSIISLILILFSFNNHNAQVFNFGKDGTFSNNWHGGVLVLNDGTKKEGLIKFESAVTKMYGMKMIGKIRFKDKESNKKKKYSKLAIDYFEIENNSGYYEKYSYEKQSKNYDLLLRVLAEGKINLYSEDVYNTMPGFSGGYPVTKMYVKKEGDEFVEYENFNLQIATLVFFSTINS